MSENDFLYTVGQLGFSKAGNVVLVGDCLSFRLSNPGNERGFVYLWVEISDETFAVVYVGKAGGTLRDRCKQHAGGFRHRVIGRAHADRFRRGISENRQYVVYVRKSETKDILGESGISMASVEELACIQKFKPPWNSS